MRNHKHIIEIDEDNQKLVIYRVLDNGTKEFFTETHLPDMKTSSDWDTFESFAKELGENVLMDSPAARRLFKI